MSKNPREHNHTCTYSQSIAAKVFSAQARTIFAFERWFCGFLCRRSGKIETDGSSNGIKTPSRRDKACYLFLLS
jgi:hypothetical protein